MTCDSGRLSRVTASADIRRVGRRSQTRRGRAQPCIQGWHHNAELTVLDGAGHAIMVEQPQELAKAVTTFLERYDRRGGYVNIHRMIRS